MNVPNYVHEKVLTDEGHFTSPWEEFFSQLRQNMQQSLSNEGFVIPGQSTANITIIQNGVDAQGNKVAIKGTLLFDTSAVNGGSSSAPNGQLKILLADGTFHAIANL
jgi:hypothetical protein